MVRKRHHRFATDGTWDMLRRVSSPMPRLTRVPGPEDLATVVHELVPQQAALGQQQAALLQLQAETVRLRRLLIERALGESGSDTAVAPLAGSSIRAVLEPQVTASEVVRRDAHTAELIAMRDPSTALVETAPL